MMLFKTGQLLFEEQRIRDDFDKDNGNGVVLNPILCTTNLAPAPYHLKSLVCNQEKNAV